MDALIKKLQPLSTIRVIRKGGNVFFQGEVPRRALIVRDGIIRSYTINSSGEERIVAFHTKGDVLPLSWVLGKTSNSLFYYDAVADARLLAVSREDFVRTIDSNADYLKELLMTMTVENTALLLRITGLEQSRAIEKVGFTLYYLMFRYGVKSTDDSYLIDMKISQHMIASLVGITRESTAKMLKVLKTKQVINYTSSSYTVNKSKLEAFLGEDGFRDITL